MEKLRKSQREVDRLYRKMLGFQRQANQVKEEAELNLSQFQEDIDNFKDFSDKRLHDYRQITKFQANHHNNTRKVSISSTHKSVSIKALTVEENKHQQGFY